MEQYCKRKLSVHVFVLQQSLQDTESKFLFDIWRLKRPGFYQCRVNLIFTPILFGIFKTLPCSCLYFGMASMILYNHVKDLTYVTCPWISAMLNKFALAFLRLVKKTYP